MQKDLNAQVKITQAFGREASKAIGDFAKSKQQEATRLRLQAEKEPNADYAAELRDQADQLDANWGDTGKYRLGSHMIIGGLTGGIAGAAGAMAGGLTAPKVAAGLQQADVSPGVSQLLTGLASTTAGAVLGGLQGGAAAFNEVENNYLKHADIVVLAKQLSQCRADDQSCKDRVIKDARARSAKNNAELLSCGNDQNCVQSRITEYVKGAQSFPLLYAADKTQISDRLLNNFKPAFGNMSEMQTKGGLIAANLSAANNNWAQWKAANCATLTDAACTHKLKEGAESGAILNVSREGGIYKWVVDTSDLDKLSEKNLFQKAWWSFINYFNSSHEYMTSSSVCDGSKATCTPATTWNALRRYAGPGVSGNVLVNSGTVSDLSLVNVRLGYVTHLVDPVSQSIVNITLPDQHGLDPGWVVRQSQTKLGGVTYVYSYGTGTGFNLLDFNTWMADPVWGGNVALGIRPAANSWGVLETVKSLIPTVPALFERKY